MSYSVKEIFYTLQGEGANAGRPAVFLRFTGCNLWSGKEGDRAAAICRFCDTDFIGTDGTGGGTFRSASELSHVVQAAWAGRPSRGSRKLVVCTGGEPLLQLDSELILALQSEAFEVAVETNGSLVAPPGLDWLCVSPKAGADLVQRSGDELKLVFPQLGAEPELFEELEFDHFLLQPMDGEDSVANTERAVRYCLLRPQWRLSLQTHKLLGIP